MFFIVSSSGLVYLLCCNLKNAKTAAMETLKSLLVFFSALAAIYVCVGLVEISHCIWEVIYEFVIGGLTLQICLGLGDAFIHSLFGCSTIDCSVHKLLESIVEPIIFIGGFFSIFTYFKSKKSSKEAQHAKYSALGNIIGSTIVIVLAIYLCFKIEEDAKKTDEEYKIRAAEEHARKVEMQQFANNITLQMHSVRKELEKLTRDWNIDSDSNSTESVLEMQYFEDYMNEPIVQLYDKKNSILAMNMLARIFAEGLAKCVEHKLFVRRIPPIPHQSTIM